MTFEPPIGTYRVAWSRYSWHDTRVRDFADGHAAAKFARRLVNFSGASPLVHLHMSVRVEHGWQGVIWR